MVVGRPVLMTGASVSIADAKTSSVLVRNIFPVSCDFQVFSVTSVKLPSLQLRIQNQQEPALIRPAEYARGIRTLA
jgi:hypothetical protein